MRSLFSAGFAVALTSAVFAGTAQMNERTPVQQVVFRMDLKPIHPRSGP